MLGCTKRLFAHLVVPVSPQLSLSIRNLGRFDCVDDRKLNSIAIWDTFPLPHIDEALQAVQSSNVFTSFDLVQGYLQLTEAEKDMKTAFRAGSSGLYEFTHMPLACPMLGQPSEG